MSMRKIKVFQIMSLLIVVITGVLCLTGVISFADISSFFAPATGVFIATAPVGSTTTETPTTETANEANSRLLLDSVDKKITEMKPGKTPIDTILRHIGKTTNDKSWKVVWYSVDTRGVEDTVAIAFDTSAASTVTSTSLGTTHLLTVTTGSMWNVDDNILVQGIAGGDSDDLVLNIVAKAGNVLTVMALNGLGASENEIPDIPAATKLTRMGSAKSELDASTGKYAIYPTDEYNYHQFRMAQVEQSYISKDHPQEVDFGINDFKAQALFDMRMTAEFDLLRGYRKKLWDTTGEDYKYTMHGLTRYITKAVEYDEGAVDDTNWTAWTKSIFVGNIGSDVRYMFCGKDLMADMMNIDSITKQIDAASTEVKFGITFNKIQTNFGTLMVLYHTLFDYIGWAKKGLVLDFSHVEKSVMQPLGVRQLDLKSTGTRNAMAFVFEEAWCPKLKYGGATGVHCIIEPSDASASA